MKIKKFENYKINEILNSNISVIWSGDYNTQIIKIIDAPLSIGWEIANNMFEEGILNKLNVEHYDVISFNNLDDLNKWLLDTVETDNYGKK